MQKKKKCLRERKKKRLKIHQGTDLNLSVSDLETGTSGEFLTTISDLDNALATRKAYGGGIQGL